MSEKQKIDVIDGKILLSALGNSFRKFDPRVQIKNFVMFIVFVGAIICSIVTIGHLTSFNIQISFWLWFTVLFANFAEAIAEGKGKAQAESLRKTRKDSVARRLLGKQFRSD